MKAERVCSVPTCESKHYARGYCHLHWKRWRTHGDPTVGRTQDAERNPNWKGDNIAYHSLHAWVRRNFEPTPCEHCGGLKPEAMEWAQRHGREGSRKRCDWLRLCVPCHRAYDDNGWWNRAKTHCPQGHPYDSANTYWLNGQRQCRTCIQIRNKRKSRERTAIRTALISP